MEPKQNYLLVGLFVLLSVAGLFIFIIWLSGSGDKRQYVLYHTYFTDSVTGLSNGASVKYRGVEVGKVNDIAIDTKDTARILIEMRILETTPINQDTVAVLKMMGITGLAYVELEGGNKDAPPIEQLDGDIPVIASRPSELSQIVSSVPEILDRFSHILEQVSRLASDENVAHISATLANIEEVSGSFSANSGDLQKALQQMAKAMEQLTALLENTNQFSEGGYREMGALLLEMKKAIREISSLTRDLKENPSKVVIPDKPGGVKIP